MYVCMYIKRAELHSTFQVLYHEPLWAWEAVAQASGHNGCQSLVHFSVLMEGEEDQARICIDGCLQISLGGHAWCNCCLGWLEGHCWGLSQPLAGLQRQDCVESLRRLCASWKRVAKIGQAPKLDV